MTGWGRLSEYGQISPVLREVRLPIISNSKCMRLYRCIMDIVIHNIFKFLPTIFNSEYF